MFPLRLHPLSVAALLAATLSLPFAPAQDPAVSGRFEIVGGVPTLTLWGTPAERGFAHGYLLAEAIVTDGERDLRHVLPSAELVKQYDSLLLRMVVPRFAFSADEEAELGGILAGIEARLPEESSRRLAHLGRTISLLDIKAINTFGDWMPLGCSSMAIDGAYTVDGAPAVVRNFDFIGYRSILDHQMLVVRPPSGEFQGSVALTTPGSIGALTAMNGEGVFASIHDVPVLPAMMEAIKPKVPRLIAIRRLMERLKARDAVESAQDLLRGWPTLYGNNFFVVTGSAAEGNLFAGVFEYDYRRNLDQGATLRKPEAADAGGCAFLACSNHHRLRGLDPGLPLDSCKRYARLAAVGASGSGADKLGPEDLFEIANLASVPEPGERVHRYRHGTLHQVVAFPRSKTMHVRLLRPGSHIREAESAIIDVEQALARAAAASRAPGEAGEAPAGR